METRVFLRVSRREIDTIRTLGAQWDAQCRRWYIPNGLDHAPFAAWIEYFLYLVIGRHRCVHCHHYMHVAAFGLPIVHNNRGYLVLIPRLECVPYEIRNYLLSRGIVFCPHSGSMSRQAQLTNCCSYCMRPQPDALLFGYPQGVFSCTSVDQLDTLSFYKVCLTYPCMVNDMFTEYRRRTRFGYGLVESCEYWYDFTHDINRILFQYAERCHTTLSFCVTELIRPALAP